MHKLQASKVLRTSSYFVPGNWENENEQKLKFYFSTLAKPQTSSVFAQRL